ncbi:ABC transporter substrate-binding protein [Microbacterium sp. A93]|uniref:ABC transporter substrate-binding protein n=1 Tax=Microbacterium sp. A93 TaxID=3450716 RepID=UPI003F435B21
MTILNGFPLRRTIAGSIAVLTAVALAGCAGGADPTASPTAERESDPTATMTVGVRYIQNSWDPSKAPGATTVPIYQLVYDNLIGLDPDGNLIPGLALSWSTEDDAQSWQFALREGVTFSDGSAFDAEDVKATLEYYSGETSNIRADFSNVSSIDVVDEHTIQIQQTAPNAGLPDSLAGAIGTILSSEVVESGLFDDPIGTGPFLLKSGVKGVEIQLVPNPDHWNADLIKVAGVTVRSIEDPIARANAIKSGDVDMAIIEPAQADDVLATAGLHSYQMYSDQMVAMLLNPDFALELDDPRVRLALAMAIDREGIVNSIMFGRASIANDFVGEADDVDPIPFDMERAKELMAEAGYADGFKADMFINIGNKQIAEVIQDSWAKLGVDISIGLPPGENLPTAAWLEPSIPLALQNLAIDVDPVSFLYRSLSTESIRNPGDVEVEGLPELIEEARSTADVDERAQLLKEIGMLTRENIPNYIPILWRDYTIVYSDHLTGVQEWQGGYPVLQGIGIAK